MLLWRNIPFLRLLLPLTAGILAAWYFQLYYTAAFYLLMAAGLVFILRVLLSEKLYFFHEWLPGIIITLFCIAPGIVLVWFKQVWHEPAWMGNNYHEKDIVTIRLKEPLTEKEKSFKALATFETVIHNGTAKKVSGDLMLYFRKDSIPPSLKYGSILATDKLIPLVENAGNPGGFDYKRYALFNGITHQLFLNSRDYTILSQTKQSAFYKWLFDTKAYILDVIRRNIKGDESVSVAEALLIGYRDDLDRDLVQAYSNTGVVHVIAISGLHLGLIYWLLLFLLKPLDKKKQLKWLKPLIAVALLWIFSLLTGAGASVVRAAIMFTIIALGDIAGRKGNIYNSMALSAFIMLLWNPFLLWDVGFQLSYAAVLSIVLFMKPIYHWFSISNMLLDKGWQLCAVTLSAQILTLPLCMYHFHQAPNLFLITNFVAVPLSSLILFGEILLIAVSFSPFLSNAVGVILTYLLKWMNGFITWVDHFSFAVTDGIQHSPLQTVLLYLFIAATAVWLLQKNATALKWSLGFLVLFFGVQALYEYRARTQQKLVVYNLSQHAAADIMLGNQYLFNGDTVLLQDGFLRNFHLKPSRILYRTYHHSLPPNLFEQAVLNIRQKKIVFINSSYQFRELDATIKADVVIISKNPKLYIDQLIKSIEPGLIIFDSSNPLWKIKLWQKDCERLHIPFYTTSEQGAFVMNL
ncbi:MAG: ComEC family competence protein [Chitinophagaceae bacterium]|nr:ComEC family competence protein [Chitinophagaceae bacterium]